MKVRLIRKKTIKEYFLPALFYAPIVGLIFFLGFLYENETKTALTRGFAIGFSFVFGIQLLGFIIMEIAVRGKQLKLYKNENFKKLKKFGIDLNDNLSFQGVYNGFHIKIFPHEEQISKNKKKLYFMINSYYEYPETIVDIDAQWEFDKNNCRSCSVGNIGFGGHAVSLQPNNPYEPDFEESIEFLMSSLQELNLKPMDFNVWEDRFIKPIREKQQKEKELRTKQILKIGKLIDIKYEKPAVNNSSNAMRAKV